MGQRNIADDTSDRSSTSNAHMEISLKIIKIRRLVRFTLTYPTYRSLECNRPKRIHL
jgi:hypothetical protein